MLSTIGKFLLDYLWGKIVPLVVTFFKNLFKKKQISDEVDKEEDELALILKEIKEYLEKNPNEKRAPKRLEDKLRIAVAKRNSGISNGM